MSYTKGKWEVPRWTRRDGDNRCWVLRGATSICRCFGKPKTAQANARLIAAAPDLLEACKYTREKLIGVKAKTFFLLPILQAIEKAEK